MVEIFTGAGAGFERGSGSVLGSAGLLGSAAIGRGNEQVSLNAATGNLLISQRDEFLVGLGPDASVGRTYNSLGDLSDDNGDDWRFASERKIFTVVGTKGSVGSSVQRMSADGSVVTYTCNSSGVYVATDGAGAYDTLAYASASNSWTWTDGDTQITENYEANGTAWRLKSQSDTDGNTLVLSYNVSGQLSRIATSDGEWIQYDWTGTSVSDVQTGYTDLQANIAKTLTRTRYTYDASNRLSTVTVDKSPNDNSIVDGQAYVTTYAYVGTTKLISSISQSDGSTIAITYDQTTSPGASKVTGIAETVAGTTTRSTTVSYSAGYTLVTDQLGQQVKLEYDGSNRLFRITMPAATTGAAPQVTNFHYDPSGNVDWVQDALGNTTYYSSFANGLARMVMDRLGIVTTRTYGAKNELLTETQWDFGAPTTLASAAFETPDLGTGSQYGASIPGMTFTGGAGLAGNGSAWGFASAPDGDQVAFLQGNATISQSLTGLTVGVQYAVKFKIAARPSTGGTPVNVSVNGSAIGTFSPGSNAFQEVVAYFVATGSTATLTFSVATSADQTTAIDSVNVLIGRKAVTHFIYDSEDHLRFTVSPEGDVTEHRYTTSGLERTTIEFAGAKYSGATFDEATLNSWVGGLDPTVQVKRTERAFDARGDVTTVTDYAELYNNRLFNPQLAGTAGWAIDYNPNNIVQAGSPYVGTWAGKPFIKADIVATAAGQIASIGTDLSHSVDVYPGESLFAQVGVETQGSAGDAQLVVHFWDANGTYLGVAPVGTRTGTLPYDTKISGFVTAPAGAVKARLEVYTNSSGAGAGSLALTAPILESAAAYADVGTNRVQDSRFEEGTAGWWMWQQQANMLQGSFAVGTDPATGKRFLQQTFKAANTTDVIAFASTDYWPIDWQVAGGERLAVRAGVGVPSGAAAFGLSVQFFDENGGWITETAVGSLSTGPAFGAQIAGFVTAPAGAKLMRLVCYASAGTANVNQTVTFTEPMVMTVTAQQATVPAFTPGFTTKSAALGGSSSATYSRTSYVYDQAGKLLTWQTDGRNAETYVYDGMGRLTSAVDVNGGTTTYAFADASTTTTVTFASGLVRTSTYTKTGELISFAKSGVASNPLGASGIRQYGYDPLGQLRWQLDATGDRTYFLYDHVGRKVADVSSAGDIIEYRFDADNRVGTQINYCTRLTSTQVAGLDNLSVAPDINSLRPARDDSHDLWSWTVYDREGRVLQTIDGSGSSLVNSYDAEGRLVSTIRCFNNIDATTLGNFKTASPTLVTLPASDPSDIVSRNFYDKDGLLVGQLDGIGVLREIKYDAAGQKIEDRHHAQATPSSLWAAGQFSGLVAATPPSASDRVTFFTYDGKGQLRFVTDANGNVTQNDYDVAGQLIGVTRYAAAIAATSDHSLANIRALLLSAGIPSNSQNRHSWAVYDAAGRAAYTVDEEGGVTAYVYNVSGHVIKQTQFATARPTSSPLDLANMNSWRDANLATSANRVSRYYYDGAGVLRYTVDGEGYASLRTEDVEGRLLAIARYDRQLTLTDVDTIDTVTNALAGSASATTTNHYDYLGRLDIVTDGEGTQTVYDHIGNGLVANVTVGNGTSDASVTSYSYDGAGRVLFEYHAVGTPEQALTRYSYDGLGNRRTVTDPDNHVTSFTYDKLGNVATQTDAVGTTNFYYDAFNNVIQTTDKRGNSSYNYYDALNRLIRSRDSESYITETSYNMFGDVTSVTRRYNKTSDPASVGVWPTVVADPAHDATTSFTYDHRGLLTQSTDAQGNYELYTLDAFGNRSTVRNKLGGVTTNSFDRRGLLLSETLPMASVRSDGSVEASSVTNKFEYDARGNRTKMIEAFGLSEQRTTIYMYDKCDRLTGKSHDAVTTVYFSDFAANPNVTVTTTGNVVPYEWFSYDKRGNMIRSIDPKGAPTYYYYDDLDRQIAQIDPLGTLTKWTYDAAGNKTSEIVYGDAVSQPANPGGNPPNPVNASNCRTTNYTYDAINRLQTTSVAGALVGSWNAANSGVATSANATVTSRVDYYGNGRVTKSTDANLNAVYAWADKLGRKTDQVDALGYITHWMYDAEGDVLSETRYASRYTGTVDPNAVNAPTVAADATNDRVTTFTYDRTGHRLTETRANVAVGTVSTTNGVLTPSTVSSTVTYTYNALGEVTSKIEATGDTVAYIYDSTGRLTKESRAAHLDQGGASVTPTVSYSYDGLNELTRTQQGGAVLNGAADRITSYSYGAGGRLAAVTDPAGGTHHYDYDEAGNVVRDWYVRTKSDGTSTFEGILYRRDLMGRIVSQAMATGNSDTSWTRGDSQNTVYDPYGAVSQRGLNGLWQESFTYNKRGLVEKTNTGDGVWRFFVYDANGNQVLAIESAGKDYSASTISQALADVGPYGTAYLAGVDATITVYDAGNQATQVIQPQRETATVGTTVPSIVTSQTYNAFGEVTSQTDAIGNQQSTQAGKDAHTTYLTYNTMGRMTKKVMPTVNWTSEAGVVSSAAPTENYYYDVSGRLVASKDANGITTSRTLLAGTGFGTDALVTKEFHSDGGVAQTFYDVFGDARILRNELNQDETRTYDAMGRLVTQVRRGGLITENYSYDLLGQRISHWNSLLGSANKETTDYDLQGRITSQRAFGGDTVTKAYSWDGTIANSGMSAIAWGGVVETDTYANGKSTTARTDVFGHDISTSDLGGHPFTFSYDKAGRQTSRSTTGETLTTTWLNTGAAAKISLGASDYTTFGYDANGNKLSELTVRGGVTVQNATAGYDALNRLTSWNEAGGTKVPAASKTVEYDLTGNIRRARTTTSGLDAQGNTYAAATQDMYFKYDTMNRAVLSDGKLVNGAITYSNNASSPTEYSTYDVAGRRVSVERVSIQTAQANNPDYVPAGNGDPQIGQPYNYYDYESHEREDYGYNPDGTLAAIRVATTSYADNGDGTITVNPPPATGDLKSSFTYDAMGRQTRQIDYLRNGTNVGYDHSVTYNAKGQVTNETTTTKHLASATGTAYDTYVETITNSFGSGAGYALGAITQIDDSTLKNGTALPSSRTTNAYAWYDGAVQSSTSYDSDTGSSTNPVYTTTYALSASGVITSASIADAHTRTVTYINDLNGQVIRRDEADSLSTKGDPHAVFYRFNGREISINSNQFEMSRRSETNSIADRTQQVPPAFNATTYQFGPSGYPDGDLSFEATNSYRQGASAGSYVVHGGETLQSIAQSVWGDSSYWYKIAEANGLSAGSMLVTGQSLTLPAGVTRSHNNAGTFTPYDPAAAAGNTSPTTLAAPKPPKQNKCGMFGQILLVAIAVAVSIALAPTIIGTPAVLALNGSVITGATGLTAALGGTAAAAGSAAAIGAGVVGGAIAGAAASIASQGVGVATGIQQGFSWKGVALAALSGGINGGLNGSGILAGQTFGAGAARGALSSGLGQGIALATGLQNKFDWAGVAAAGVSAGVGSALGSTKFMQSVGKNFGPAGQQFVGGMAADIANAASRSLINGSDFGGNLLAGLPDVIGQTIGGIIADGVSGRTTGTPAPGSGDGTATGPTAGDKIIVTADRVHTPNLITDGVDFSDIDAEWADLQLQGNMLLLEATGGDVGAARQMLKESFAPTYDQVRASATPAPGATAAHYDYTAPTGSPGSYDDVMPVTDRPDFLQPGGGLTIGNVVDVGGGKADWVVNTEKTASMNAALAGFDNDMIEMSTLGPRYGAELATGDFAIGLLAKGINLWRAGRVIEAADAEVLTGVRANQLAGSGREALARAELEAQYPGASIQNEVYLRSANGGRAIDPLTGEARRIDSVVIQDGQVLDSVEVTSMNANKAAQIAKEMRIRQSGGAFVRDRGTGNLIDISQVLTRIVRKP
jgi:trimeric autotransporter adhesin